MISVGIHENIVLNGQTGFTEEGYFRVVLSVKKEVGGFLDALEEGEDIEPDSCGISIYGLKSTNFSGESLTVAEVGADILNIKHQLTQVLSMYQTVEQGKAMLSNAVIFRGLGITEDNLAQMLCNQTTLDAVTKNILDAFLAEATRFFNDSPFRILLRRQSAAKHYPSFPPRGKGKRQFVESMEIPVDASKLKFDDWELSKGYDNGTPVQTDVVAKADVEAAEDLFGTPTDAPKGAAGAGLPID